MKNRRSTKIFSVALAAGCWLSQQAWAQAATQSATPQPAATAGNTQSSTNPPAQAQRNNQAQAAPQPTAVAESAESSNNQSDGAPDSVATQPVTTYPDASGAEQKAQSPETNSLPAAPQPKAEPGEPQGAATAEKVSTAGGAAAKPAGAAIAPPRQHRTRSLLIKVGALAAAGVAAGTVYALSRGTPSVPPGSTSPIAVPK
ncbi:MAG TPA: hypothetical protein VKL40_05030 [Candidatus Angelobacter sp.]|nr:hypothetical protein [Candidatus Angelobacter sp.]